MRVLIAVLDDLWKFTLTSLFGVVFKADTPLQIAATASAPLQPLLPLTQPKSAYPPSANVELVSGQESFFVRTAETAVRQDPVVAFDNVITTLRYGDHIKVLKYGGRWAMIQSGEISGWMLKDDVSTAAADVFPVFSIGQVYDAEYSNTQRLRAYIGDQFAAIAPAVPLTSAEYVTYRLLRARRVIVWPLTRPRLPGAWQTILRGRSGIHIGIIPKTGSVMEFLEEEHDEGMLLYVEAVFPDESIQVSSVGFAGLGVYTEDVLTKETWQSFRPVFIEVS